MKTALRLGVILCLVLQAWSIKSQDYATLYFYREKKLAAAGETFKIYLNKLEVAQIHNGGRLEYRIYKPGRYDLMVGIFNEFLPKADNYKNISSVELKPGDVYFIEGDGNSMEIVSESEGAKKYAKHKDFEGMPEVIDTKPFDYEAYSQDLKESNSAPKVLMTEPALVTGSVIDIDEGPVMFKGIVGSGDAVKSITINGTEAVMTSDKDFTAVVQIKQGQNQIKVSVLSKNGARGQQLFEVNGIGEKPETPQYRGGGDPLVGLDVASAKSLQIKGSYYALIIGIDQYSGHWNPLSNAVNDAKAIESMLASQYRFNKFITLYNQQATRANILAQMEYLVNTIKPEDNLLIYYSGHGEFKESLDKGYWVPVDSKAGSLAEYISNSDIQTFLGAIDSKHTLLISDACFSGDIFRGNTVSIPFEDSERYFVKVESRKSRQAISSGGIEPVMDGGSDGHSVFAYYLLKALKENDDPYFDSSQLYNMIKIPVINNSRQTPKFSPIKDTGDEGGQFIFVKK